LAFEQFCDGPARPDLLKPPEWRPPVDLSVNGTDESEIFWAAAIGE
jgi:hypothetical protein